MSAVWLLWLGFFAAHVPLALAMESVPLVSTLHALLTLGVGLWYALTGREAWKVALVGAYIAGAEVLWRMTDAAVFWEFGKYAVVAIFAIAIMRFHHLAGDRLPLWYFALLLPSAILTLSDLGPSVARYAISFNLSGPLSLTICAWFFSRLKLSRSQLLRLFLAMIAPITGIATLALHSTLTSRALQFTDESNFVTSGGGAPNQVSNMLGLGALLALIFLVLGNRGLFLRALMLCGVIGFGTLSAVTFSRSGLYNAGIAAAGLILFLTRDIRSLAKIAFIALFLFLIANYFVLPGLDSFTGGALSARFQDTGVTGRDLIFGEDLQIWADNPIFGVGPGVGSFVRDSSIGSVIAHTEPSRMLAEHGILGLAALLLLVLMSVRNVVRKRTVVERGLAAAMALWALFFMLNSAMRLVAPALVFGLAFAIMLPQEESESSPQAEMLQVHTGRGNGADRAARRDRATAEAGG